jgi:thiamine-phosphate pyrophosphorylase
MQNVAPDTQALYRILDANLDRAREGIRVVEEWCRFGLKDQALTALCKDLRQQLGQWHHPQLRAARQTESDPGTDLTHAQEQQRADIASLLLANLGRIQEALRVLEEYGKLYDSRLVTDCKQMRYRIYTLETQLLPTFSHSVKPTSVQRMSNVTDAHIERLQLLREAPLYLVTSPQPNLVAVVEAALQAGLTLVQYRDKTADDQTRLGLAQQLVQLCHHYGALFIVNDRVDLALAVNADGVHLGQQDLPVAIARQLLGPNVLLGRSTTNPVEFERAIAEAPDYIGVGPVYATPTKAGRPAAGFEYVRYAKEHAFCPWFAIGGIDPENVGQVMAAGATQVSVVRAIMAAADPGQVTQDLLGQLRNSTR